MSNTTNLDFMETGMKRVKPCNLLTYDETGNVIVKVEVLHSSPERLEKPLGYFPRKENLKWIITVPKDDNSNLMLDLFGRDKELSLGYEEGIEFKGTIRNLVTGKSVHEIELDIEI